jgi:2-polyprenyl-3-methyl-5-hydroxy-6-metoxy-1,4-benzoquinol methylase
MKSVNESLQEIDSHSLKLQFVPCGVCGSSDSVKVAEGKDYEYETSPVTFQIMQCLNCQNLYLNPRPAPEELPIIYPPTYYSYNMDEIISPLGQRLKAIVDVRKVRSWLKHVQSSQPRFLDVGCGDGRYLRVLHSLGVPKSDLFGIENSHKTIERLSSEGYNGVYGTVEEVAHQLPQNAFDLIVIIQVLEHVSDPAATIGALKNLLAPKGVLIVETPNTDSFDRWLFRKRYWGGYHIPRHWNLMKPSVIRRLVEGAGMQVVKMRYLPAHSFWIYSFHHAIAHTLKMPRVAKFFSPLENIPLIGLFTSLDFVRAKLGFHTSNMQVVIRKQ